MLEKNIPTKALVSHTQLFGKNEGMSLVTPALMAKMGDGERQALIPKNL